MRLLLVLVLVLFKKLSSCRLVIVVEAFASILCHGLQLVAQSVP